MTEEDTKGRRAMTWKDMLDEWNAIFKPLKDDGAIDQTKVAQRGQLSGQNVISKMRANRNQGPQVETFIRAIIGLGLKPSEFFQRLEARLSGTVVLPESGNSSATIQKDKQMTPSVRGISDKKPFTSAAEGSYGGGDRSVPARRIEDILAHISEAIGERAGLLTKQRAGRQVDRADRKARQHRKKKTRKG